MFRASHIPAPVLIRGPFTPKSKPHFVAKCPFLFAAKSGPEAFPGLYRWGLGEGCRWL